MDASHARVAPTRLPVLAAATLAGCSGVQVLEHLPAPRWFVLAATITALGAFRWRWLLPLTLLLLGAAWADMQGAAAMAARLPAALAGQDIEITGEVVGLPEHRSEADSFRFRVERARRGPQHLALHGMIRLAWYGAARPPPPCSHWQLRVRLRRPRGLSDPGVFDAERYALQQRQIAVGYVRGEGPNRRQDMTSHVCLDALRAHISRAIRAAVTRQDMAHLLAALAVGDKRGLSQAQRQRAQATGVSHLLAISGFHIGVAALAGVWLVRLLWGCWPGVGLRVPRPVAEACAGLASALLYASLAGWSLPTQRALVMIAVAAAARCGRRHTATTHALAAALLAVLAFDPLAVLSVGFWLSFGGVAFMLCCLSRPGRGWRARLLALGHAQWVMTLALLPMSVMFFGQASLIGPLANVFAVPGVSLVVVPLTLLGVALSACWPGAAAGLWSLAAYAMQWLWAWLGVLSQLPLARIYLPLAPVWALPLAMLGARWCLMPRGTPLRALSLCLFLPLLWPGTARPAPGGFSLWLLDVGQGLSVVVRTHTHALVYDTGARYPSGYSLGERVVVPVLHALGIRHLDRMIISHGDNDHAGGAPAVHRMFPAAGVLAGEPARLPMPSLPCHAGQRWTWDGVDFRMLSPPVRQTGTGHDNDRSCVLLIRAQHGQALLTGDISARIEPGVADRVPHDRPLLLLVPHHGSKTSSSRYFLDTLRPSLALVSAGWHNRYGHPAGSVVARYRTRGIRFLNTARQGAMCWRSPAAGAARLAVRWRPAHPAYWRE